MRKIETLKWGRVGLCEMQDVSFDSVEMEFGSDMHTVDICPKGI